MNSTVQRHAKDGISQFNVYRSEFILGGKKKKKEPFLTPGSIRKQIYYDRIKLVAY